MARARWCASLWLAIAAWPFDSHANSHGLAMTAARICGILARSPSPPRITQETTPWAFYPISIGRTWSDRRRARRAPPASCARRSPRRAVHAAHLRPGRSERAGRLACADCYQQVTFTTPRHSRARGAGQSLITPTRSTPMHPRMRTALASLTLAGSILAGSLPDICPRIRLRARRPRRAGQGRQRQRCAAVRHARHPHHVDQRQRAGAAVLRRGLDPDLRLQPRRGGPLVPGGRRARSRLRHVLTGASPWRSARTSTRPWTTPPCPMPRRPSAGAVAGSRCQPAEQASSRRWPLATRRAGRDRAELDLAYAEAMRDLVKQYPDDLDAPRCSPSR